MPNNTNTNNNKETMNYYIQINHHRTSTSHGFDDCAAIYRCENRAVQHRLLNEGLPVGDIWHADGEPVYSTNGISVPSRAARRREEKYGWICEFIDR